MPVGADPCLQQLIRIRRVANGGFQRESPGDVRFMPLIGEGGWRS